MMTPDRWRLIGDFLDELALRGWAAASELVESFCQGDASLRTLLAKYAQHSRDVQAMRFLERPIADCRPSPLSLPTLDTMVGQYKQYRLLRLRGTGGMGVVYEAEQSDPRRIIALKIINPAASGHIDDLIHRFNLEKDILGKLKHVGIAHLYEAGTFVHDGQSLPYFAMELIEGLHITEYVKVNGLAVHDRLRLLTRVCDAVHSAHDNGIIHRDLKPANILVQQGAQPKIVDFGIAGISDHRLRALLASEVATFEGGTFAYMSPEQLAEKPTVAHGLHQAGEDDSDSSPQKTRPTCDEGAIPDANTIDRRSDVFALGIITYELLAERHPFVADAASTQELRERICVSAIPRLAWCDKRFRGDLDCIVAKAMARHPWDRYGSAREFAEDIESFLEDRPVAAHHAGFGYRGYKYLKRNRAVLLTALGLLTAALFMTFTYFSGGPGPQPSQLFVHGTPFPWGFDRVKPGTTMRVAEPVLSHLQGHLVTRGRELILDAEVPAGFFRRVQYHFEGIQQPDRVSQTRFFPRDERTADLIRASLITSLGVTDMIVRQDGSLRWHDVCGMRVAWSRDCLSIELAEYIATMPACMDGADNDGDGAIDYPLDTGCSTWMDGSEVAECEDGLDNDGDGLIDYRADPECTGPQDNSESFGSALCGDGIRQPPEECDDGNAIDGDGCSCACKVTDQCNDGVDNDGDGLIDYPDDPDCDDAFDNSEAQ